MVSILLAQLIFVNIYIAMHEEYHDYFLTPG